MGIMTGSSVLAVAGDASARPGEATTAAERPAKKAVRKKAAAAATCSSAEAELSPPPVPVGMDMTLANRARLREFFLGGKDFFDAERAVWERLRGFLPQFPLAYRDERSWRGRVATYLARTAGVRQFVVCQPGFPEHQEAHEVHEIVQALNAEASVLYVEQDRVASAYGRAFREINDRIKVIDGPLDSTPEQVFATRAAQSIIDLDEPVALLQVGSLQHISGTAAAQQTMAAWVDQLAAGSYVAVSHLHTPGDDSELAALADRTCAALNRHGVPTTFRTDEQISAFFDGLEMIEPGLVTPADWWPVGPQIGAGHEARRLIRAGVAAKPAAPQERS